ncbi:TPA: hypothetical protein M2C18_004364 [Escherichia coli]|uniref:hypothetical protein n=1 Tax=Escherichia coli TaxID=562 RepID=UPI0005CE4173|nr:hypothetical protein [Escherichia coli]EFG1701124.1 hypothetical protein [Escherichia coli]EFK4330037.1 hypothetical protein [Escherichia coli]EHA9118084.1 hypothetical protein [Escherichia coli]EJC3579929.1 hypothetical protein [Escherichia coli]EJM1815842.1 hypothetical protein [Escherichia coli]
MINTKTPFVLLGLNSENYGNFHMLEVFANRGYNIIRHSEDSNYSTAFYALKRNGRPTVIIDCLTDEGREQYQNLPAIIVREYDVDLGSYYGIADLDQIMADYGKQPAQEAPEQDEEDEEDEDYAPICFSSQNGFYGYDEGLDML